MSAFDELASRRLEIVLNSELGAALIGLQQSRQALSQETAPIWEFRD